MIDNRVIFEGAPTGFRKTAVYLIPILSRISEMNRKGSGGSDDESSRDSKKKKRRGHGNGISALILVPTRELAEQVHREAVRLVNAPKKIKTTVFTKQVVSNAPEKQENFAERDGFDYLDSNETTVSCL